MVFLQAVLGGIHHRSLKAKQRATMMGIIHRFLGPVAIVLAIPNGVL